MKINKSDKEWQDLLTPEEYTICRQKGTERAFTGCYWDTKTPGRYLCKCCHTPLFNADSKYDSCSGWPSFFRPIDDNAIEEVIDNSHGMQRTEVVCHTCGSHLGHVFPDGPAPSGLRYCINSASLRLEPNE